MINWRLVFFLCIIIINRYLINKLIIQSSTFHYFILLFCIIIKVNSSPKGQVEIIMELSDLSSDMLFCKSDIDAKDSKINNNCTNPFELDNDDATTTALKTRFSLPGVRKLIRNKRDKPVNRLSLKITTSKMKCSIKVKEEFENNASKFIIFH